MTKAFLRASHHNWSMMGPGDWSRTSYSVFISGVVRITTAYRPEFDPKNWNQGERIVRSTVRIDQSTIDAMKAQISQLKEKYEPHRCYDGSVWAISTYDQLGNRTFFFEMNYIYGLEDLENLVRLLP